MSRTSSTRPWRIAVAAAAVAAIASLTVATAQGGSHEFRQEGLGGCVYYNPVTGTYGSEPGPGNPIYYNPVTGTYGSSCV